MDIKETYNKIATDWAADHNSDTWWVEGTRMFAELLPAGAYILDAGCGSGVKTKYLSELGFKVDGFDISENLLDIAKKTSPTSYFFVDDFYDQRHLKSYDAIFAQASLLHVEKSRMMEVLKKLVGHINPEGFLYMAVKERREGKSDEEIARENDYGYDYERYFSYYTMEELRTYLNDLGLTVRLEHVELSGKTRWLQIVGQKGA